MNDSLQNIFFWNHTLHLLYKIECLLHLLVLKIVNDEIQSGLRNDINEWWQCLKSILTSSEYNEIVPKKIIVGEYISSGR